MEHSKHQGMVKNNPKVPRPGQGNRGPDDKGHGTGDKPAAKPKRKGHF